MISIMDNGSIFLDNLIVSSLFSSLLHFAQ